MGRSRLGELLGIEAPVIQAPIVASLVGQARGILPRLRPVGGLDALFFPYAGVW